MYSRPQYSRQPGIQFFAWASAWSRIARCGSGLRPGTVAIVLGMGTQYCYRTPDCGWVRVVVGQAGQGG